MQLSLYHESSYSGPREVTHGPTVSTNPIPNHRRVLIVEHSPDSEMADLQGIFKLELYVILIQGYNT